jgi:hypothetical protein
MERFVKVLQQRMLVRILVQAVCMPLLLFIVWPFLLTLKVLCLWGEYVDARAKKRGEMR